jgi:CHAT domain-containing protein
MNIPVKNWKHTFLPLILWLGGQSLLSAQTAAEQLISEGLTALEQYQYQAAAEKATAALQLLSDTPRKSPVLVSTYTLLSRSYERRGVVDTAIVLAQKAIDFLVDDMPPDVRARAHGALSSAYFANSQRDLAIQQINTALSSVELLSLPVQTALYAHRAVLMLDAQRSDLSLMAWASAAQKSTQQWGRQHPLTIYYQGMQNFCLAFGMGRATPRLFDSSLDAFASNPDRYLVEQLMVQNLLIMLYTENGQFSQSVACAEKAQRLAARVMGERHPRAAILTLNAGNVAFRSGDMLRAVQLYKSCIAHFPAESQDMAKALDNLGLCYLYAGMADSAYFYNQKGLTIRLRSPESKMDLLTSRINQAIIAHKRSNFKEAEAAAQAGLDLAFTQKGKGITASDTLELRSIQAFCAVHAARYDEGIATLKSVLSVRRQYPNDYFNLALAHQNLGDAYWEQGDITRAFAQYDTTLWIIGFPKDGAMGFDRQNNVLWGGGLQAHRADRERQLGVKNKDMRLLERAFERSVAALSLYDEYRRYHLPVEGVFQTEKNFTNAIFEVLLATALDLHTLNRQTTHLERVFALVDASKGYRITDHLRRQEAMDLVDFPEPVKTRARRLEDAILSAGIKIGTAQQPNSGYPAARLNQLLQKQNQLVADYRLFRDSLLQNAEFRRLSGLQTGATVSTVRQSLLEPDEMLLEYIDTGTNTYVFVVNKDAVTLKKIDLSRSRLYAMAEQWRETIQQLQNPNRHPRALRQYADSAYYLYQVLLGNLGVAIPSNLTIVPDGILVILPFDALLRTPAASAQVSGVAPTGDLDYLVRHHAIRLGFSAAQMLEGQRPVPQQVWENRLLALAPFSQRGIDSNCCGSRVLNTNRRTGFEKLSYSGPEVDSINRQYQGQVLKDSTATKAAFLLQAPKSRMLHIAAHGVGDPSLGYRSMLLFAEVLNGSASGILSANEIYGLSLPAELTVLSACETTTGSIEDGEGALGLARAFVYAGSRSVVATHWSVNDGATATLMKHFYRNMLTMPKHRALQEAKKKYIGSTNPAFTMPYLWAAPVLYGGIN